MKQNTEIDLTWEMKESTVLTFWMAEILLYYFQPTLLEFEIMICNSYF
jgi:hypothetical protein